MSFRDLQTIVLDLEGIYLIFHTDATSINFYTHFCTASGLDRPPIFGMKVGNHTNHLDSFKR